jgi:hypothetical protein
LEVKKVRKTTTVTARIRKLQSKRLRDMPTRWDERDEL